MVLYTKYRGPSPSLFRASSLWAQEALKFGGSAGLNLEGCRASRACRTLKKVKGVWGPHLEVVKDPMGWGQKGALGFFRDVGSQSKRSPEPRKTDRALV